MKIVIKKSARLPGILEGHVFDAEMASPDCEDCVVISKRGVKYQLFPDEYVVLGDTKTNSIWKDLIDFLRR